MEGLCFVFGGGGIGVKAGEIGALKGEIVVDLLTIGKDCERMWY